MATLIYASLFMCVTIVCLNKQNGRAKRWKKNVQDPSLWVNRGICVAAMECISSSTLSTMPYARLFPGTRLSVIVTGEWRQFSQQIKVRSFLSQVPYQELLNSEISCVLLASYYFIRAFTCPDSLACLVLSLLSSSISSGERAQKGSLGR